MPCGLAIGSAMQLFRKYPCGIKNLPINIVRGRKRSCYVRSAKFPDITGKYSTADRGTHANAEGAIQSILTENTARFCSQVQVTPPSNGFAFSARLSNAIYSNFTVQSPSFQIFMIVKA